MSLFVDESVSILLDIASSSEPSATFLTGTDLLLVLALFL